MEDISAESVKEIVESLSGPASNLVSQYAEWHFAAGLAWVLFGAIIILIALKFKLKESFCMDEEPVLIIRGLFCFFGALFVVVNIPDLISPEAVGVHQLIKDIRG